MTSQANDQQGPVLHGRDEDFRDENEENGSRRLEPSVEEQLDLAETAALQQRP